MRRRDSRCHRLDRAVYALRFYLDLGDDPAVEEAGIASPGVGVPSGTTVDESMSPRSAARVLRSSAIRSS